LIRVCADRGSRQCLGLNSRSREGGKDNAPPDVLSGERAGSESPEQLFARPGKHRPARQESRSDPWSVRARRVKARRHGDSRSRPIAPPPVGGSVTPVSSGWSTNRIQAARLRQAPRPRRPLDGVGMPPDFHDVQSVPDSRAGARERRLSLPVHGCERGRDGAPPDAAPDDLDARPVVVVVRQPRQHSGPGTQDCRFPIAADPRRKDRARHALDQIADSRCGRRRTSGACNDSNTALPVRGTDCRAECLATRRERSAAPVLRAATRQTHVGDRYDHRVARDQGISRSRPTPDRIPEARYPGGVLPAGPRRRAQGNRRLSLCGRCGEQLVEQDARE